MCLLICSIKKRGGEFANIIMQGVKKNFWEDVFRHYKKLCGKCVPVTFDDFASEYVHYNVNICRRKRIIFIRKWIDCGIISVGQLFCPDGCLIYNELKAKFHNDNIEYLLCGRIAFLSYFSGRGKFYDPLRHSGRSCLTEVERQFGAAPSARFVFLVKVLNCRN